MGPQFSEALAFANDLHRGQMRKGTKIPYVAHLLAVTALVIEVGGDEEMAIAALLHDAVEDRGGRPVLDQIRQRFGQDVTDTVEACSDTDVTPKPPWRKRKEAYIAALPHKAQRALRVSLADKVHNAEAILADYRTIGEELWRRFNAEREDQLWYYQALAEAFAKLVPGPLAKRLSQAANRLKEEASPRASSA